MSDRATFANNGSKMTQSSEILMLPSIMNILWDLLLCNKQQQMYYGRKVVSIYASIVVISIFHRNKRQKSRETWVFLSVHLLDFFSHF